VTAPAAGADVNAKDGDKDTPLHAATFKSKLSASKVLLDKGAQVCAITRNHDVQSRDIEFQALVGACT
jgi:ankyrin repeat protein